MNLKPPKNQVHQTCVKRGRLKPFGCRHSTCNASVRATCACTETTPKTCSDAYQQKHVRMLANSFSADPATSTFRLRNLPESEKKTRSAVDIPPISAPLAEVGPTIEQSASRGSGPSCLETRRDGADIKSGSCECSCLLTLLRGPPRDGRPDISCSALLFFTTSVAVFYAPARAASTTPDSKRTRGRVLSVAHRAGPSHPHMPLTAQLLAAAFATAT
ncbi:hypothetical protein ACLOJK_010195 [Asimina triloba]